MNRSGFPGVSLDRAQKSELIWRRTLFRATELPGEKSMRRWILFERIKFTAFRRRTFARAKEIRNQPACESGPGTFRRIAQSSQIRPQGKHSSGPRAGRFREMHRESVLVMSSRFFCG